VSAPGDAAAIARRLGMERLPVEGTLWRQTWIGPAGPGGAPAGTAMLGLYAADPPSRSLFHRLASDEVWHFHAGDPLRLVLLHPDGSDEEVVLGGDPRAGAWFQHVVPAGTWQAGELVPGGAWALFGCTMAPGFTAEQFEGGAVSTLLAAYPARAADVRTLGVPDGRPTGLESG
jgi:predicted cupin superfamily sugar epimerase